MALDQFKAPPLPNPSGEYDPQYLRQLIRALEIYFAQLDSSTPNHAQQYTATTFIGGSFAGTTISGTNVTATDVNTTTLESQYGTIGYQASNGIKTSALIAYGALVGRMVATDVDVGNVYADYLYGDGRNVWKPYNDLQSTANQTLSAIDQAVAITYNVNNFPDGISVVSNSRVTVQYAGVYQFIPSIQFTSSSTGTELINLWFRKNGTDIASSNTQFSIPARKNAGTPAALCAVTPFTIQLAANDYIEVIWGSTATTTSVAALSAVTYSAGVTPAIPATPSVILEVQYISSRFPLTTYVAPLPVFGFGQIGSISVKIH